MPIGQDDWISVLQDASPFFNFSDKKNPKNLNFGFIAESQPRSGRGQVAGVVRFRRLHPPFPMKTQGKPMGSVDNHITLLADCEFIYTRYN